MGRNDELYSVPLEELVEGARRGEAASWEALVHRMERVVWKAVHMTTSDTELQQDAFAATWLKLAEHLHQIREPRKLPGWLTTTATNEVRKLARAIRPQDVPIDSWSAPGSSGSSREGADRPIPATDPDPADMLIRTEAGVEVRRAFRQLSDECRQLLTVLVVSDPRPSYAELEVLLGRPHGYIGPTRRRCLEKLRKLLAVDDGPEPPRQPAGA
jgi:RNA polymerase sigma factor (sigma-70 family)